MTDPRPSTLLLRVARHGEIVEAPGHPDWRARPLEAVMAAADRPATRAALDRADGRALAVQVELPGWPPTAELVVAGDGPEVLVALRPVDPPDLALDEMVSVVAHEVKNPLAGIGGALDVLRAALPEAQRERRILDEAKRRVHTLDETLEDLLLLTRPVVLDKGPTPLWATVSEVTRRAAASSPNAPAPDLGVPAQDPSVRADPVLLPRALFYLVDHAIRVSERPIQIRMPVAERTAEVVVQFAAGALEQDIGDRVFDPHFLERSRRTGLHLPVARRILEAHGGAAALELGAGDGPAPDVLRARVPR